MNMLGMKVVESPLANMTVPNRKHKRRRWMSEKYHKRIQKKWTKRFGTHQEPCAILFNPSILGMPLQEMMALPPGYISILRNFK